MDWKTINKKTEYRAAQVVDENDLDELLSDYFDEDARVCIAQNRVSISSSDYLFKFNFGDWFVYNDENSRIRFVAKEDFEDQYEIKN